MLNMLMLNIVRSITINVIRVYLCFILEFDTLTDCLTFHLADVR